MKIPNCLSNITLTKRNMFVAHDITNLDCDAQQGRLGASYEAGGALFRWKSKRFKS